MKDRLEQIKAQALEQIKASDMPEKLNEVRVKFLGKKGELTAVLKGMKDVAPEERPKVGQLVNETRAAIEELLEETKVKMEAAIREEKMKAEVIDVTLPSKKSTVGHRHPNTIALEEVERLWELGWYREYRLRPFWDGVFFILRNMLSKKGERR